MEQQREALYLDFQLRLELSSAASTVRISKLTRNRQLLAHSLLVHGDLFKQLTVSVETETCSLAFVVPGQNRPDYSSGVTLKCHVVSQ